MNPGNSCCVLILVLLSLGTCESSSHQNKENETTKQVSTIDKDELVMTLSLLMSADTTRAGRDHNDLINYAIDQLYDVKETPSGLLYQILEQGDGAPIAWGDFLSVHYSGKLIDGSVFADSRKQNKPLEFYVGNMIDAWNEGLQLINVGGKLRLLAPSRLAYGKDGLKSSNGKTIVPPHQLLIFEVEVLEKKEN